MSALIQIAPECPNCQTHHTQSFTREDLSELLRYESVSLYCPRLDKSWQATREQRQRLTQIAASLTRVLPKIAS